MDSISFTKQQAFSLFNANRLAEAQTLFEKILQLSASDIDALNLLSAIHGMAGDYEKSECYCRRALKMHPNTPSILNNLANALKLQGKLKDSEKFYRKVIKLEPGHLDALTNLGSLLWLKGNKSGALKHYKKALSLDPKNPDALTNMGTTLQEEGQLDEAMSCYQRALVVAPDAPNILYNAATILSLQGQHAKAHEYLKKAVAIQTDHADTWSLLASTTQHLKDLPGAVEYYQKAIELDPRNIESLFGAGLALKELGEIQAAASHFRRVLEVDPDHDTVRFFLSTLGEESVPEQCPENYVSSLFDDFAETFDSQLLKNLEYNAPSALRATYDEAFDDNRNKLSIIDLGCGTGLSGEAFSNISKRMIGIDLSPKMLEKAKQRNIYSKLIADDICRGLQTLGAEFELAICVDTFVYIGDLAGTMDEISNALSPDGIFTFTVERLDENLDYRLNASGRYSHNQVYIRKVLKDSAMDVLHVKEGVLRQERGSPMQGYFFVAQKTQRRRL